MQAADTPERLDRYEARLSRGPRRTWTRGPTSHAKGSRPASRRRGWWRSERSRSSSGCWRSRRRTRRRSRRSRTTTRRASGSRTSSATMVNPAFARYRETLRDYLPHCTETIGLSALPDGDELYADVDPRVDDAAARSARGARRSGSSGTPGSRRSARRSPDASGTRAPPTRSRRTRRAARTRRPPATRCSTLAREQVERSWEASRAFFGRMPHDNCDVRPVEEFREQDTPLGFYNPPTEDGSRRGAYYINTSDLPGPSAASHREPHVPRGEPRAITSSSRSSRSSPTGPRCGGSAASSPSSAFAEGWGLYSERLADEMGLYLDDWERLGMLEAQGHARRASGHRHRHPRARMVARAGDRFDGGRSARRTSTRSSRSTATSRSRGRRSSYMIGMIEIERARRGRRPRGRAPRSRSPTSTTGCSRWAQLPLPGAPPRARLTDRSGLGARARRRYTRRITRRTEMTGGAACSTSTSGSSPSFAMANVKLAQGERVAGGGRRDEPA